VNRSTPRAIYNADLTAGSLKLRESRLLAGLLLADTDELGFRAAVQKENILQCRTVATAVRLARLIRGRLQGFDPVFWKMVAEGSNELAVQCLLAAAVKQSALLRDFISQALRDEYRALHTTLAPAVWVAFLDGCAARDPSVATWHETTARRLRSTVFQILAQAGFLSDTRNRTLQKVTILPDLAKYLRQTGDSDILRSIQIP